MSQTPVVHNTFVLERSYPKPPEAVFAAFSDADKKRRWFAEGAGHDVEEYSSEFREGGVERLRYRFKEGTPFPGVILNADGTYQNIVEGSRIVTSSTMSIGGKCISATLVTIELLSTGGGTKLVCTHQGAYFEGSDGPQMREMGWKKLFDKLSDAMTKS